MSGNATTVFSSFCASRLSYCCSSSSADVWEKKNWLKIKTTELIQLLFSMLESWGVGGWGGCIVFRFGVEQLSLSPVCWTLQYTTGSLPISSLAIKRNFHYSTKDHSLWGRCWTRNQVVGLVSRVLCNPPMTSIGDLRSQWIIVTKAAIREDSRQGGANSIHLLSHSSALISEVKVFLLRSLPWLVDALAPCILPRSFPFS